jgi:hypothetical protein
MHVRGLQNTTASMVVSAGRDGIHVRAALGNPCVSVFVPLRFGAPGPAFLSSEATWWRFARLRDRVEQDAATLSPIRAVLGPVEAALTPAADLAGLDAALTTLGV